MNIFTSGNCSLWRATYGIAEWAVTLGQCGFKFQENTPSYRDVDLGEKQKGALHIGLLWNSQSFPGTLIFKEATEGTD